MLDKAKEHLRLSKTSYLQHLKFAVVAGVELILVGFASIIHGFIPNLFQSAAAMKVIDLYHKRLINHPNPFYQEYILRHKKRLDNIKKLG